MTLQHKEITEQSRRTESKLGCWSISVAPRLNSREWCFGQLHG